MLTAPLALLLTAVGLLPPASAARPAVEVAGPFPYQHVSVVLGTDAPGTAAPADTLWVTVDDGTPQPRVSYSRAIPANGRPSLDAAYSDPTACEQVATKPGVCWRYWQRVANEVRIWTTYHGSSCVLIADLTGNPTRVLVDKPHPDAARRSATIGGSLDQTARTIGTDPRESMLRMAESE